MKRLAVILLSLASCTSMGNWQYRYVPLADYKSRKAVLADSTELHLIAFSGADREPAQRELLYYQFIVRTNRGDTLRVLAPMISFPESETTNEVLATPTQLQKEEAPESVRFRNLTPADNLMLQATELTGDLELREDTRTSALDTSMVNKLREKISFSEKVVIPDRYPEWFGNERYRTARGIICFDRKPWKENP